MRKEGKVLSLRVTPGSRAWKGELCVKGSEAREGGVELLLRKPCFVENEASDHNEPSLKGTRRIKPIFVFNVLLDFVTFLRQGNFY